MADTNSFAYLHGSGSTPPAWLSSSGSNSGVSAASSVSSGSTGGYSSGAWNEASSIINAIRDVSDANSALSQKFSREQMDFQREMYNDAKEYNSTEAAKNRDWQAMMSNSAHQREVQDLIAAGLNPILSAQNGNGASVGSGATASVTAPQGASGTVDTSANGAIVNLLGQVIGAKKDLDIQNNNAYTNLRIADQNNTTQYKMNLLTNKTNQAINALTNKVNYQIASEGYANSKDIAQLQTLAQIRSATINAGATVSAANISSTNAYNAAVYRANVDEYIATHVPTNGYANGAFTFLRNYGDLPGIQKNVLEYSGIKNEDDYNAIMHQLYGDKFDETKSAYTNGFK